MEAGRLGGGQKSCGGIRPIFCMSVEGSGAARLRGGDGSLSGFLFTPLMAQARCTVLPTGTLSGFQG